MNAKVFKNICKVVFPKCYIRCNNRYIPIYSAYLWRDGPYFAHLWEDKCVAWRREEDCCKIYE